MRLSLEATPIGASLCLILELVLPLPRYELYQSGLPYRFQHLSQQYRHRRGAWAGVVCLCSWIYFTYSVEQIPVVKQYIINQKEHHRQTTFAEEYRRFIMDCGCEIDERFFLKDWCHLTRQNIVWAALSLNQQVYVKQTRKSQTAHYKSSGFTFRDPGGLWFLTHYGINWHHNCLIPMDFLYWYSVIGCH